MIFPNPHVLPDDPRLKDRPRPGVAAREAAARRGFEAGSAAGYPEGDTPSDAERRAVRDLDRLQRERYLILRSLRVAHRVVDGLGRDPGPHATLPQLVDFLQNFACEHFFCQEEAVLEGLVRELAAEAYRERLRQLRRDHELGRAILASVREALGGARPEPRRLRGDLSKLILQLSQSLMRGQDAVTTVEVRIRRGRPGDAGGAPAGRGTGDGAPGSVAAGSAAGTGDGTPRPGVAAATGDGAPRPAGAGGTGDGGPAAAAEGPGDLEARYRRLLEELERIHAVG